MAIKDQGDDISQTMKQFATGLDSSRYEERDGKLARRKAMVEKIEGMPKKTEVRAPKAKGVLLGISIYLPIRLLSEMNVSEHWTEYAKRNKAQQEEVKVEWYRLTRNAVFEFPILIRLTRIGRKLLDPGNIEASFKHVQDAICYCLGVDDGDRERVRFEYWQEDGKSYGVKIEVRKA